MDAKIQVRSAYKDEWKEAMELAWKTFLKFEADVYSPEGIRNFEDFVTDTMLHRMFLLGTYQLFVAVENSKIVGMITLRNVTHISLLFVDESYHKQGVGRRLVEYVTHYLLTELGEHATTVNSSPYGIGFYHKLGFCDIGPRQEKDGIIFTPMELILG